MNVNEWRTRSFVVNDPNNTNNAEILRVPHSLDNQTEMGTTIPVGATLDTGCLIVSKSGSMVSYIDDNTNGWSWVSTPNQSASKGSAL